MSAGRRLTHQSVGWRRRTLGLITVASVLAFAVPGPAGAVRSTVTVHPTAYRDQPPLAYVSDGHVFVLDGSGRPPRVVDGATGACCVAWAPDGQNLAFQRGTGLWITQADGRGTRRVAPRVQRWAWAPDGEALAVIPEPARPGAATGVDFYATERPHAHVTLLRSDRVLDLAWAGLGRRLAVLAVPAGASRAALFMLEVAGPYGDCAALCPEPAQPVAIDPSVSALALAGWSPTVSSLAVWTGPDDAGGAGQALELSLLSPAGGGATAVAATIVNRSWIQWSPAGDRLLVVVGGGPDATAAHVLELCVLPSGCRALNGPETSVVDPAWSRAGQIASVVTPLGAGGRSAEAGPSAPAGGVSVADGDGGEVRVVARGAVSAPYWLPDNRHLVFVRGETLWLIDADHGAPVAIAGPLDHSTADTASATGSSISPDGGARGYAVAP